MDATRRSFLSLIPAAGAAGAGAARAVQSQLAEVQTNGLGGTDPDSAVPNGGQKVTFSTVADWWKDHGPKHCKKGTRRVHALDPDLASRRQPIATLVRIQRARNFERFAAEERATFLSRLGKTGGILTLSDYN